jgi:hypothetical protein
MMIRKAGIGFLTICAIQALYAQPISGLRVALTVKTDDPSLRNNKMSNEITTVFTRELRELGDVRVVPLSERYNERLDVLVTGGMCTTLFVVVARHTDAGDVLVETSTLGHMKNQ